MAATASAVGRPHRRASSRAMSMRRRPVRVLASLPQSAPATTGEPWETEGLLGASVVCIHRRPATAHQTASDRRVRRTESMSVWSAANTTPPLRTCRGTNRPTGAPTLSSPRSARLVTRYAVVFGDETPTELGGVNPAKEWMEVVHGLGRLFEEEEQANVIAPEGTAECPERGKVPSSRVSLIVCLFMEFVTSSTHFNVCR